jgi:phenylalanyl-tRNA synthetase beta chain
MRRLGMHTEGGQRWARGVDPAGAEPVCDQAARLMATLAGGTVAAGRLRAGPGVGEREAIRLDWTRSSERLGAPGAPEFAAAHLRRYGCRTEVAARRTVLAVPPTWRFDLELWADLEEEVARGWGYDQILATLPGATGGGLTDAQRLRRLAREVLAGMGVTEVQTYPFLSQAALDRLGLPADDPRRETLRLANPLSEEAPELRTTLLPGLAEVAGRNLARGLDEVAVYELGAVFLPNPKEELPAEPLTLGILLAGQAPAGRFDDLRRPFDFADVKGVVEGLVRALGVPGVGFRPAEPLPYHPGRCAAVLLEDRPVGLCGQLHPRVAAACELPATSFAVEVELGPLLDAVPRMRPAATPSPYPELSFDVAFLVPPGVAASDLEDVLAEAGGELLARLTLFDAYQGPPLPPGHRNLAYRVALQAADRTLTDADGAATRDRMAALAAGRLEAILRTAG